MLDDRNPHTDDELIKTILEGDINRFEVILNRYQDHVFSVVAKHIPSAFQDDVAQDVFIRSYQSLKTYNRDGAFKYWLTSITLRTCYDFWRKRYRSRENSYGSLSENHLKWVEKIIATHSKDNFDQLTAQNEAKEVLEWALGQLTAAERLVVQLVHLEQRSVKETAALLGWSRANVKVRAFRSRKKLHEILKNSMKNKGGAK
ncbi:RNA polymerase sigma factor [candidate division CSSED10-310 bacterium]|uniref:RNA polymerase sigma factor n=1 Tax=candidate division CSSED10-310 bacterium TaxID=2855610 RepID=A0ABV6YR59_UNCC1